MGWVESFYLARSLDYLIETGKIWWTSMRVLIAEDDPVVAMAMAATVKQAGFAVAGPVGRVSGALSLIRAGEVDVAVLDADLHGESSAKIAKALRANRLPFIVISGYSAEYLGDWLGDATLIGKPCRANRLLAEIERLKLVD